MGQVEPMEEGGQPGVEIVGLNTPVFYDEFRRLEAGRRLLNSLVGWEGGRQRSGHGSMGVQEVRGGPSGSSEGGAVINQEVVVQL